MLRQEGCGSGMRVRAGGAPVADGVGDRARRAAEVPAVGVAADEERQAHGGHRRQRAGAPGGGAERRAAAGRRPSRRSRGSRRPWAGRRSGCGRRRWRGRRPSQSRRRSPEGSSKGRPSAWTRAPGAWPQSRIGAVAESQGTGRGAWAVAVAAKRGGAEAAGADLVGEGGEGHARYLRPGRNKRTSALRPRRAGRGGRRGILRARRGAGNAAGLRGRAGVRSACAVRGAPAARAALSAGAFGGSIQAKMLEGSPGETAGPTARSGRRRAACSGKALTRSGGGEVVQRADHVVDELAGAGVGGPLLGDLAAAVHDDEAVGDGEDVRAGCG